MDPETDGDVSEQTSEGISAPADGSHVFDPSIDATLLDQWGKACEGFAAWPVQSALRRPFARELFSAPAGRSIICPSSIDEEG
jgi:hypothetical protein